jgi:Domain of unknown function (DUF222)/HNH endonuclease
VAVPVPDPDRRTPDGARPDPEQAGPGSAGQWLAPMTGPERGRDARSGSATARAAAPPQPDRPLRAPDSAADAIAMTLAGLGYLAAGDAASLPAGVLAECLRGLERVLAVHTAARARVLTAFIAQRGYEDDGQGSPRTWLTWQTRITRPAAAAALGWTRRLADHPAIADALARAEISASWAWQMCDWTSQLPAEHRDQADAILLAAACGGADLAGVAELAEQIRARLAAPDRDRGDGFADRGLRLSTTLGGAGRLTGDLSARCAAALQAILDTLGKKAGPEDTRTRDQRHHDALEDAFTRLIAARCLPDRAGQPVQLQLHLSLDQLLNGIGRPGVPWLPPGYGTPPPKPGSLTPSVDADRPPGPSPGPGLPAAGPGDDCDAALAPIVTGRIDHDLADKLAGRLAGIWAGYDPARPPAAQTCHDPACCSTRGHHGGPDDGADSEQGRELSRACARELILRHAVTLLSGPDRLASWLRTGTLPPPGATISLPLDIGAVTDLIPPHLRRAIITRDQHCAAPGCDQPPPACHIHHIVPRSRGGTTSLANCLLMCPFHHLIAIHRWGWTIALHADGTTAMTSPDGRTLHSHSPPAAA